MIMTGKLKQIKLRCLLLYWNYLVKLTPFTENLMLPGNPTSSVLTQGWWHFPSGSQKQTNKNAVIVCPIEKKNNNASYRDPTAT